MRAIAAAVFLIAISAPALASRWTVTKDEQDPFDASSSTFIAQSFEGDHAIAVRCLQKQLSFAMTVPAGDAGANDSFEIKIVGDKKAPIDTRGQTLSANTFAAAIQFGDEETADYLLGVKRYWVRVIGGETTMTYAFTGGSTFDSAIGRAEKACGLEPQRASQAPVASPDGEQAAPSAAKDCTAEKSCARQFDCLASQNELGEKPDRAGFSAWCRRQPRMRP